MKPFEQVVLVCPVLLTGGPEALHQLAQIINELGTPANIAYHGNGARIDVRDGEMTCTEPETNPCLTGYEKYNPLPATRLQLTDKTLVILPEVRIGERGHFAPANIAIWWLSVNNAFHPMSSLNNGADRRSFFADTNIHHFCQTFYSRKLLEQNGVQRLYDLVDFTDDLFTLQAPKTFNDGPAIAYNPKKGAELANSFFEANPNLEQRRIQGMSKRQIIEIFRSTRVYLEFGHNPGKDRMPREAASAGCVVLAHKQGGTSFFDDVPLDSEFKFTEEDVASGRLASQVRDILANPRPAWEQQAYYRRYLRTERDLMKLQAARIFG